jgi:hypothetical protein
MTDAVSVVGFYGSEIETEILPSKTGSEFSHSLVVRFTQSEG